VAVEKIKRKFGVEIELQIPKIPYKETIRGTSKVEYKHKKQSGGSGQYGHVWLELEPLDRSEGFEFGNKVVGGSVPREYVPAVEKGVVKAMARGVLAGFPVVDVRVRLVDGSSHPVDSSGIAFEIAGSHALSQGVKKADPTLLEPVLQVSILAPDSAAGEITGGLSGKRGQILGMTPDSDGYTCIEAEVPQAEMLQYATELRSLTGGRGLYTASFVRMEMVPDHLLEKILEQQQDKAATA
jgi:elongation factor G